VQDQEREAVRGAALHHVEPRVPDVDHRMPISELSPTMNR
jgi:hypothetical protein